MTKKVAYMGMLVALAFIFSYIESLIPITVGIPGIKLGLANMVIIVTLFTMGTGPAFVLSLVRIVLTGFTFGNLAMMMYSLGGGMLSLLIMVIARKLKLFSVTGVSVLGAVFHNIGQILVAAIVVENSSLFYYLPVLLVSGVFFGGVIGMVGAILIKRLSGFIHRQI
ncbi:Gx transporter family protein [Roseburia sp. 499]|uniref:Gx transporter family protein n=1 Tax=Roseburia sp. 499 TaxID=1261634 RepID=UPI000951858F|nr:Gx transporter family protein [Roseburia sp. 499]WVK69446.1 Gx transporter family protein [Roseburia sp. 499]